MASTSNSGKSNVSPEYAVVFGLERRFGYLGYGECDVVEGVVDPSAGYGEDARIRVRRCGGFTLLWEVEVQQGSDQITYGYSGNAAHKLVGEEIAPDAIALPPRCSEALLFLLVNTDWQSEISAFPDAA